MFKTALVALFIGLSSSAPRGSYCGGYDDIASGKITVESPTTFTITITVFGSKTQCPNEAYEYFPSNSSFNIPGLKEPTDCLAKLLNDYGLYLEATYDSSANVLELDFNGGTVVNATGC